jgi:Major Facilitator Superfamily
VFAGDVLIVLVILLLTRRMKDTPGEEGARLDLVDTALSALGLGAIVLGILKAGTWGFVRPKPDAPEWFGLSPVIWLVLAGALVLVPFVGWENRRVERGEGALIDPGMLRNLQLRSGVMSFLLMLMFLIQAGIFFTVPLFLSVALGISAVETGVRLLPLSLSLLLLAVGVPKVRPAASPRRVVRLGFLMLFAGLVLLVGLLDVGVGPEIVTWPLLLAGSGLGMMASQLGAVTVSSVPDENSGEVGGLQNTGTQLGASIGTALAGAVLISAMTASFFTGIESNPNVPDSIVSQAQTQLAGGVPFMSQADAKAALQRRTCPATADEIIKQNEKSQIDGLRAAEAILALCALAALPFTRGIPIVQPGAQAKPRPSPA